MSAEGTVTGTWIVWRQDDHGNRAEVARFSFQDEADELCKTMEARGHKQLYWVAPA
ncbi:MAG TPA: hypothetical protein VLJ88_07120 [Propionibacteriaceae bacterium]|nr:hypothetical protein [Propionibacteriaceae bacterium]